MARPIDLQHSVLVAADLVGVLARLARARHGWVVGLGVEAMTRDVAALGEAVAELGPRLAGEAELSGLVDTIEAGMVDVSARVGLVRGWRAWRRRDRLLRALDAARALEEGLSGKLAALDVPASELLDPDDGGAARGRARSARLPGARVNAAG